MSAKKKETGDRLNAEVAAELPGDSAEHAGWRQLFVEALPLLEWVAAHGSQAGPERQEEARRIIVRHYIAATRAPEVARVKRSAS